MEIVGQVLENKKITLDFFHLKLKVPRSFAMAKPGQFLHVRISSTMLDPLMRRPLSLYRVHRQGKDWVAEVLYRVVGHGTQLLSCVQPGESVSVLGPQGHAYEIYPQYRTAIMVAGGYGVAPLYFLCEKLLASPKNKIKPIHVIVAARSKELLLCVKEFQALGVRLYITTNDGSLGQKGLVTDCLEGLLGAKGLNKKQAVVYACGSHPMLKKVAEVCHTKKVACQVSMEERMGCSVGVCLGCVCKIKTDKKEKGMPSFRYQRVCTEGPVFDAEKVIF